MKICTVDGCGRPVKARGWCDSHDKRARGGLPVNTPLRRYEPRAGTCRYCMVRVFARGLCQMHYGRLRSNGNPLRLVKGQRKCCAVAGCFELARTRGWCNKHYKRWQHNGSPLIVQRQRKAA